MQPQHGANYVEVNQENFRAVITESLQKPVLLYFWAPASEESQHLIGPLKQLAEQYNGAFKLALLDCQADQAIAMQCGVQQLPTLALFSNGQPVDGLGGPQPIEAVKSMLDKHLPSADEMNLTQALTLVGSGDFANALTLLNALPDELKTKGETKLALAECYLETSQFELAEQQLQNIPLEYKDNYYKGLVAKLELHQEAANSPEITALETAFQQSNNDPSLAKELAAKYHEVNRDEEALEMLWIFLSRDLNALDGEMKRVFMDILSALGQGNPLSGKYRRQLYSMMY
ncbi:co-chaperone YbbN [Vibrio viridaestus]|uniref:Co-chaperone YbbN n=1 Tax=Vibrio viridaestus TaxID=2487322 RepID=A0A3N9TEM7_9VIBR|nr:co-chaperone YbbN [Vibrio viridaestus]RQW62480.1 co-chaperone YbbN [Vibrio viridaestus]